MMECVNIDVAAGLGQVGQGRKELRAGEFPPRTKTERSFPLALNCLGLFSGTHMVGHLVNPWIPEKKV